MAQLQFSRDEAIKFGWQAAMDNLGFFIRALIIIFVVSLTFSVIGKLTEKSYPFISLAANIIYTFFSLMFGIGLIKIYLKIFDSQEPELSDLTFGMNLNLFLSYLVVSLLYTLIIIGGLILFIFPGIYWAIQFQFCTYLVIDKGMGPVEALKKSSALTKGVKWDLFVLGILLLLIILLGILALFIGLFVAIPLTMMAVTFVYRKLLSQSETAQNATAAQAQ
jgi:uncharacterized membrane protein